MNKILKRTLLMSAALAMTCTSAIAQNHSETFDAEEVEVIKIQGKRPATFYFKEYEKAKEAMYEAYNQINDEKQFAIDCRVVKPVGSQIAKKECLPRFYREESAYQSQLFLLGASNTFAANDSDIAHLTKYKQKAFYQHIEELAKESPELLAHLQNISNKLEAYLERKNSQ
ncbi:hypothetical protein [Alteromonas facilis]|uniref:hypothetical protein n=1 Tax=Alteromonas facilis TaxID=2048004 RepID=UPI000C28BCA2|nr:hypothetical protein [Alteromonas facilis]